MAKYKSYGFFTKSHINGGGMYVCATNIKTKEKVIEKVPYEYVREFHKMKTREKIALAKKILK